MPTATKNGVIQQIIGVVLDLEFEDHIPDLYNALTVEREGQDPLVLEVAQHLSANVVRAIALGSTDGLKRGQTVVDTGAPISVPIGKSTLGRMFNVTGQPIDGKAGEFKELAPIHK